ncbi:uncharacterized protein TNIN_58771 [Trichonephila inaurata madagascariensis]|uniref:Uncharacterized protein n=1 Tax=Trichonephila inaurata madagascariensis TaxID=2747483 RepID=A0A8X6MA34_9ARAC|nr:uncharacterized protein TNIN_58771 [Trichonephila inaurata madagascariensis]
MDLDEILHDVGDYGKYQKLMLWFVLLPSHIPFGTHYYSQVFMSLTPHHWCHGTTNNVDMNITYKPLTVWSRSDENKLNPSIAECYEIGNKTLSDFMIAENNTVSCKYGYDYDRSELYEDESIITMVSVLFFSF